MNEKQFLTLKFFKTLSWLLFGILILRLIVLQVIRGDYYLELSENNRQRTVYIPAPRGKIFDRNKKLIADNIPTYNLELIPKSTIQPKQILHFLSDVLNEDILKLEQNYQLMSKQRNKYQPQIIYKNISRDNLALVAAQQYKFPGLEIMVMPARHYTEENVSHITGYIREITAEQLKQAEFKNYLPGDLTGQQGVEKYFEHLLQGQHGKQTVLVNAQGQKTGEFLITAPKAGKSLHLSIDLNLQKAAELALAENSGAVIAINPKNGEILALLSNPRFNPNLFNQVLNPKDWNEIISHPQHPMTNRVIRGTYPPGSIFKIFMAAAALNEGIVSPEDKAYCPGHFKISKNSVFHCHKRTGHGSVNLEQAIAQSCNVYFYTLGQKLGIDKIHHYAELFGLGELTGIEIPGEKKGLVPSREWKEKNFSGADKIWYRGETPSVVIGQGAVSLTPIQIARALAALVNGGHVLDLTLLKNQPVKIKHKLDIPDELLQYVKQGMLAVVNSKIGTGKRATLPEEYHIQVAGKTATAQIKSSKHLKGHESENHAWFAGFAPYEDPRIVIVALVEHGGHGGESAAPVVRKVLEEWAKVNVI